MSLRSEALAAFNSSSAARSLVMTAAGARLTKASFESCFSLAAITCTSLANSFSLRAILGRHVDVLGQIDVHFDARGGEIGRQRRRGDGGADAVGIAPAMDSK